MSRENQNSYKKNNNDKENIIVNRNSITEGVKYKESVNEKLVNLERGNNKLNNILIKDNEILGIKELRNNISDIFSKAINNFQEILTGNAKKGGKTISILSTDLLDEILELYKFNTIIDFDEATRQYEINIPEIDTQGSGDTKEEAIEIALDNAMALTEDYFEELQLYMHMENTKKQYPYFLRIKHCKNRSELIDMLNLV